MNSPYARGSGAARWRRYRDVTVREAGASTAEMVLLLPLVAFMTLMPVQAGLVWHGRQVMEAAAQEGARAARAADLTAADAQTAGELRAQKFADSVGGNAVSGTSITVSRNADSVRVDVSGKALTILPVFNVQVRGHAVSPVERFVAP